MSRRQIERAFPSLLYSRYRITSPPEKDYNCNAWAAGDMSAWWEPDPQYICYWPDNIPRVYTVEAYVRVFQTLGFTQCQDAGHEDGFEKVSIYISSDRKPAHAARQLGSGLWTSKLGNSEDIEHGGLAALEGQIYGAATVILKRRVRPLP